MTGPALHFPPQVLAEIERILGCETLEVIVKKEWGSANRPIHRADIRRGLATHFGLSQPRWLNVLDDLPEVEGTSVSISHGLELGGFATCRSHARADGSAICLGFDVEGASRISDSVVRRISSDPERLAAPDARYLWGAKESVYKSLRGPDQPEVITDIEIRKWIGGEPTHSPGVYAFTAHLRSPPGHESDPAGLGRGAIFTALDQAKDEIFTFFARNRISRLT